jgi:hypothetical protein
MTVLKWIEAVPSLMVADGQLDLSADLMDRLHDAPAGLVELRVVDSGARD